MFVLGVQAQNISLVGQLNYTETLNDIWGWADPFGHEYALVGVRNGLSIVDVSSDPANPTEVFFVSGPRSTWRDMKTWGNHAYVIHDNVDPGTPGAPGMGLLIVDLSGLPGSIDTITVKDFGLGVSFDHAHNVFIDEMGILYVFGANFGVGGAIMLDLNGDPEDPQLVGFYNEQYVHDGFARDNILYTAEIYTGNLAIIDVTDKSTPVVVATQQSPTNFTHNVWLSDDDQFLFTTDEVEGGYIGAFDVSDPSDITELSRWRSNPGSGVIPHNSFVYGTHLITSYYRDGVTVHDISRPSNMVLTGLYDTSPLEGPGFDGCWGVYPYTPSGLVYATDVVTGFYVLDVDYVQAAWLEGTVTNSSSGIAVSGARISIPGKPGIAESNVFGAYGTGADAAGTYDVVVEALGYTPQTISGVSLTPGLVTTLDISLDPLPTTTFSGQVVDETSGAPIPGASIALIHPDYQFAGMSDASGNFSISGVYQLTYEIVAGKWGYISESDPALDLSTSSTWEASLTPGIYDDFTFNFGWSSLGSTWLGGAWERAQSIPYDPGFGVVITPEDDYPGDPGKSCYVTGNSSPFDFVHAGEVVLRSPEFDPSNLDRPTIRFQAWVYNTTVFGTASNDGVIVRLSDPDGVVNIDTLRAGPVSELGWLEYEYEISDFKAPGAGMRILFGAKADGAIGVVEDLLEVAIDFFRVEEYVRTTGVEELSVARDNLHIYPNPARTDVWIEIPKTACAALNSDELSISFFNMQGKEVQQTRATADGCRLSLSTTELPNGIYSVQLQGKAQSLLSGRLSVLR